MTTLSSQNLQAGETALQSMSFSTPVCRYESVATFTNTQGHQFDLRVTGIEEAAIRRYIEEVRLELEILPDVPVVSEKDEVRQSYSTTEKLAAKPTPDREVTIAIEPRHTEGLRPPYVLRLRLDPTLDAGQAHTYTFTDALEARVTVSASGGQVSASLAQGGQAVANAQVDVFAGGAPPNADVVARVGQNAATNFELTVTGGANGSKYSLRGDVKR
jgi:hypothetical protein